MKWQFAGYLDPQLHAGVLSLIEIDHSCESSKSFANTLAHAPTDPSRPMVVKEIYWNIHQIKVENRGHYEKILYFTWAIFCGEMLIAFVGVTTVVILNDLFFHVTPTLYICCVNLLSSSSFIVSTVCLIELRRLNYLIRLICSGEGVYWFKCACVCYNK